MQALKFYENHRSAQFLWDIFHIEDFKIWNGGFFYKTTSLLHVQNNPKNSVYETSDSQAWNQTGLNEKTARVTNTLKEFFPPCSFVFLSFHSAFFFPTRGLVFLSFHSVFFSNTWSCISIFLSWLFFPTCGLVFLSFHLTVFSPFLLILSLIQTQGLLTLYFLVVRLSI